MLKYNWNAIFKASDGNVDKCFRLIKMLVYKELPDNRYDSRFQWSKIDFTGHSFLLRPKVLMDNAYLHTKKDICVYAALAAKRPYADYLAYGTLTLPVDQAPLAAEESLEDVKLFSVLDGLIHFNYEETLSEGTSAYQLPNS